MKNYKNFLKELPSKTVVLACGRFNPPTLAHEVLVRSVKKLAEQKSADHVIYASNISDAKKNPLLVEKKLQYLDLVFPKTNFVESSDNLGDQIKKLKESYKNVIVVTSADKAQSLSKYDVQTISISDKDPDLDDTIKTLASKGLYEDFKKKLPTSIRELDSRRLMNDIRQATGLDVLKEELNLVKDQVREQYFRGEIFNVDDIVESEDTVYKIVKRGSNHLLVQNEEGRIVSKWIQDVKVTTKEFMVKEDLTDKTLKPTDKIKVARIIATMLGVENAETSSNPELLVNTALRRVRNKALNADGMKILDKMLALATEVGIEYDTSLKPNKLKESLKKDPSPEEDKEDDVTGVHKANEVGHTLDKTGNDHLRRRKVASFMETYDADYQDMVKRVGKLAKEGPRKTVWDAQKRVYKTVPINVHPDTVAAQKEADDHQKSIKEDCGCEEHEHQFCPECGQETCMCANPGQHTEDNLEDQLAQELDLSDEQIDHIVDSTSDDDILDVYDDEEFSVIDPETGEEIEEEPELAEQTILEVLSRSERMRARVRFAKTKAKRERKAEIALKTRSSSKVINKRSRRLAIKLMKKRLLRGRDVNKISVGEKERIERALAKRKAVINRVAMKLAPRVRRIESARLTHSKYTKGTPNVSF